MDNRFFRAARKADTEHKKRRIWRRVVTALSGVVIFCTTYALILPAITMDSKKYLVCAAEDIAEHTHTDECWNDEDELICGYADFVVHEHEEICYDKKGKLVCDFPEIEEHEHTRSCYSSKKKKQEVHTHDDSCYAWGEKLTCGEEEEEGHTHSDSCLDENGEIVCGEEESEGHQHTDDCKESVRGELICTIEPEEEPEEDAEEEIEEEPKLSCGEEEVILHEHNEDCFDEDGNWICGKLQIREHQHTEDCFENVDTITDEPVPEEPESSGGSGGSGGKEDKNEHSMTYTGADYAVSVFFTEEAKLPENVELSVQEILPENDAYETYFQQTNELLSEEEQGLVFCRFFDVSFLSDGVEVEPEAPVEVQVSYAETLPQDENVLCNAVHFAEDGVEVLPAEVTTNAEGDDTFVFSQESFSVVGTTISALNLSDGSYIFYKDGYAIGQLNYGIGRVEVTIDENGYIYPKESYIGIDRITWTYTNGALKNKYSNQYLSLGSAGVNVSSYAGTVNARIINNVVRFSSPYGSTTYYLGVDGTSYKAGTLFADGDYFIAAKVEDVDDVIINPGDLEIEDRIKEDGCLHPKLNTDTYNGKTLSYAWYRSDDGGTTWTQVERKKITGSSYNVAEDGSWLNVALDKGADTKYKVALVTIEGNPCTPIESGEYKVPYYDSIQNGSFENPKISTNVSDPEHYQPLLPNGTAGLVWKTTAPDGEIELISVASTDFKNMSTKWHNCESAAKGVQYAELNANAAGSLYQDVLTTPDSTMYWSLAHRGRGISGNGSAASKPSSSVMKDTMYVVIMSIALAEQYNVTTQEAVQRVINNPSAYPGAKVEKITDDATRWYYHQGEYTVPEDQYLTRYFFVAGPTYFDDYGDGSAAANTVGNHLDDIYFSTELPPPAQGYANVVLEKTIVGLDEEAAENLLKQLKFTLDGKTVSGADFVNLTKNDDGSYTAVYQETVNVGTAGSKDISVSEDLSTAEVDGYKRTGTTMKINDSDAWSYDGSSEALTIAEQETKKISFTNSYEPNTTSLKLKKTDGNGKTLSGAKFSLEVWGESGWETVDPNIFVDENGEVIIQNVPYNKRYRLTETTAPDGYYILTEPVYFKLLLENGAAKLQPCDADGNTVSQWPMQVSPLAGELGLEIINRQGMILPETGGSGVMPIYLCGCGILFSVVVFAGFTWRKNRKGGTQ